MIHARKCRHPCRPLRPLWLLKAKRPDKCSSTIFPFLSRFCADSVRVLPTENYPTISHFSGFSRGFHRLRKPGEYQVLSGFTALFFVFGSVRFFVLHSVANSISSRAWSLFHRCYQHSDSHFLPSFVTCYQVPPSTVISTVSSERTSTFINTVGQSNFPVSSLLSGNGP